MSSSYPTQVLLSLPFLSKNDVLARSRIMKSWTYAMGPSKSFHPGSEGKPEHLAIVLYEAPSKKVGRQADRIV